MTPPDSPKRRILADWLHKADGDVAVAEHLLSQGATYPNAIAFRLLTGMIAGEQVGRAGVSPWRGARRPPFPLLDCLEQVQLPGALA